MKNKIKMSMLYICAFYVFIDIGIMTLEHYETGTRDETCRNIVMEIYYNKYGSLEGFPKRAAQSRYVEDHGTLEGFIWK